MIRFNRVTVPALAILLAVVRPLPLQAADSLLNWDGHQPFKVYRAYSASDGRSYIEEIAKPSHDLFESENALYIHFASAHPQELGGWHYAAHRHLIISVQGDSRFDTGDGKDHLLHPGEAILIEDWSGKGHRSGCDIRNKVDCVFVDVMIGPNDTAAALPDPPR